MIECQIVINDTAKPGTYELPCLPQKGDLIKIPIPGRPEVSVKVAFNELITNNSVVKIHTVKA